MKTTEARATLDEVRRLRTDTRDALNEGWFAYVLFGLLCLGAALVAALADDDAVLGAYWAAAGLIAGGLLWLHYQRFERELGAYERHDTAFALIVGAMLFGAFGIGFASDGDVAAIGPLYPVAAGLVAFALVLRHKLDAVAGISIALLATALFVISPADPAPFAMLGEGIVLLFAGAFGRFQSARSRWARVPGAARA